MAEGKNIASNSRPKNPMLPKNVRNYSNLQCSLCRPVPQFDLSNTVGDPIEVEKMEDPFESGEQESAFGEEASSEEDSKDLNSALGSEMT